VAELRNALKRSGPVTASEQPTFIVAPPSPEAAPLTGLTNLARPGEFDRETLKKIEVELATHIGPIAPVVLRASAKKAYTLSQLAELLGAEIPDAKIREAFVKKIASVDKSVPAGAASRLADASRQTSQPVSAPPRFDAATLSKAETALAQYIGAVARVVVRRAAAKARDEAELYLLIADEIEDKNEKKTFIRKAMSISGRT